MFLQREPATDLGLICTGAPGAMFDDVLALSQRLLPDGVFGFAGYLSEPDFAALLRQCRALIFPSLYEGFGLPVLEAMACDRPVLCSDVTSLPEVAADAAVLFDPYRPSAIADAIVRLEADPTLEATLVTRGHGRVAAFGTARRMAEQYLAALEDVVARRSE
jgi:glycosyltransferase involved in cell wall biosynthesis